MNTGKIKSVGLVTAALFLVLAGCALKGPYRCYLGSYPGRVVDRDTGKPLEGVVIHVTYSAIGSSAAGAISVPVAVRETLSNANGEYLIPADTVLHECFSGELQGHLQIFKPGYGRYGHHDSKISCPKGEEERVSWAKEPVCLQIAGKYLIVELPQLKSKEERWINEGGVSPRTRVPYSQQILLIKALNEERKYLGLSLIPLPIQEEAK